MAVRCIQKGPLVETDKDTVGVLWTLQDKYHWKAHIAEWIDRTDEGKKHVDSRSSNR